MGNEWLGERVIDSAVFIFEMFDKIQMPDKIHPNCALHLAIEILAIIIAHFGQWKQGREMENKPCIICTLLTHDSSFFIHMVDRWYDCWYWYKTLGGLQSFSGTSNKLNRITTVATSVHTFKLTLWHCDHRALSIFDNLSGNPYLKSIFRRISHPPFKPCADLQILGHYILLISTVSL